MNIILARPKHFSSDPLTTSHEGCFVATVREMQKTPKPQGAWDLVLLVEEQGLGKYMVVEYLDPLG